jgi:succinate dehydrogenase flavin-adding protein (antitoxin of CptAB toxin-antitoxin module)
MSYYVIPSLEDDFAAIGLLKESKNKDREASQSDSNADQQLFFEDAAPRAHEAESQAAPVVEGKDDLDRLLEELDEDLAALDAQLEDADAPAESFDVDDVEESFDADVLDLDRLMEMVAAEEEGDLAEGMGAKKDDDEDDDEDDDDDDDDKDDMDEMYGPERDSIAMGGKGEMSPIIPKQYMSMYKEEAEHLGVSLDGDRLSEAFVAVQGIAESFADAGVEGFEALLECPADDLVGLFISESSELAESSEEDLGESHSLAMDVIEELIEARGLWSLYGRELHEARKMRSSKARLKRGARTAAGRKSAKLMQKLKKGGAWNKQSLAKLRKADPKAAARVMAGLKAGIRGQKKRRTKGAAGAARKLKMMGASAEPTSRAGELLGEAQRIIQGLDADRYSEARRGFAEVQGMAVRLSEAFELFAGSLEEEGLTKLSEMFRQIAEGAEVVPASLEEGDVSYEQAESIYDDYVNAIYKGVEIYNDISEDIDEGFLKKYLGLPSDDEGAPYPTKAFDKMGKAHLAKNSQKDGVRPYNESTDYAPYAEGLDGINEMKEMDPEEMKALKAMAQEVYEAYGKMEMKEMGRKDMEGMLEMMGYDKSVVKSMPTAEMRGMCSQYHGAIKEMMGKY